MLLSRKNRLKKLIKADDTQAVLSLLVAHPKLKTHNFVLFAMREGSDRMLHLIYACLPDNWTCGGDKWTFAHIAAEFGKAAVLETCLKAHPDAAKAVTQHKVTPLHTAAHLGEIETVTMLLDHGADVNAAGYEGRTPLHTAARTGHAHIVTLLLAHGADSTLTDEKGRTALGVTDDAGVKYALQQHAAKKTADLLPQPAVAAFAVPDNFWRKIDNRTIALVHADNAGYRLTEVFNFGLRQCIALQRNLETNAETALRVPFEELKGCHNLAEAAAELQRQGGRTEDGPLRLGKRG